MARRRSFGQVKFKIFSSRLGKSRGRSHSGEGQILRVFWAWHCGGILWVDEKKNRACYFCFMCHFLLKKRDFTESNFSAFNKIKQHREMILSSQWFKINDRWCIRPCINISRVFRARFSAALIYMCGPIFFSSLGRECSREVLWHVFWIWNKSQEEICISLNMHPSRWSTL